MKYKFYNENNEKLIIFFNGWGMDEFIISHLDRKGYDLLVFYDYTNLDTDFPPLNNYKEKYLIGWSMGVMISTLFYDCFGKIDKYIAINGTPKSIDNQYGIPEKIYKLTLKGFNENSCRKFIERMFDKKPTIEKFSDRTLESQREELQNLMGIEGKYISFDKVLVSENDNIIPTKNQLNYWRHPVIIKGGHCPFFEFKSWSEIVC